MIKLDAVNEILEYSGLNRVSALETGDPSSAGRAEAQLDATSLKIQGEGWHFNTTRNELVALTSGELVVPAGTIKIDTAGYHGYVNVSLRGDKLWDNDNNTFTFANDLYCTMTLFMEWGCIPFQIRRYIMLDAAKAYNGKYGHRTADQQTKRINAGFIQEEWTDAKREAHRYNEGIDNLNMLDTVGARTLRGEFRRNSRR